MIWDEGRQTFAPGRRSIRGAMLVPLVVSVAAVVAMACGGGDAQVASPGPNLGASAGITEERLWLQQNGARTLFHNGDAVQAAGMDVEIYVSPYPPARTANIDFYVTRDGQPVETADLTLQYDMTVMEHGPFRLLAAPTGRGHYLAPVDFAMSGDFWLNVAVDTAGTRSVINLLVRAAR